MRVYEPISCFIVAIILVPQSFAPPPLPQLWVDSDIVILGLIDNISLVNQTDLYTVYDVEVTVAEYLQDPANEFNIIVRYNVYSTGETENSVSFEKGERTILFLNLTKDNYYILVRQQGKFTFSNGRYENIYGEIIDPPRGDTSVLVIGIGTLLLVTITATFLIWGKRRFTPVTSQLKLSYSCCIVSPLSQYLC